MGLVTLYFAGCRKGEEQQEQPPEPPSHSPAVYMKDTNFLNQVAAKKKELQAILKERKPLADRMQQLVKEHGEDLSKLQKIDEWNELHKKIVALNAKYEEVRARQLRIVRERIAPKKEISK